MSSVDVDVTALIDILRSEGSDVADIEAKKASGGYPASLIETLCAFGNMPGGGTIVLGLDEQDGFRATGVYDPVEAQRRLADQARTAVTPPLQVTFETALTEGATLVVARVSELPARDKPCSVIAGGRAYLRSYDGDYALSAQEQAAFVAERGTPRFDRDAVSDTGLDDLDRTLVAAYLATCRSRSPRLAVMDDDGVLRHTRVIAKDGHLTLAGLYALSAYPQLYIPTLAVTARVARMPGDPPGTRSQDIAHLDGPLPDLLDQAVAWVRRNTSTRVRFGDDGHGRDEPAFPVEAVRELVANALVHRDIGPHALGDRVHLVLEADRLIVANPGGLFGLTVAQLGTRTGGSARNQSLYDIAKDIRTPDGRRIIEGIGTGITAAREALHAAGMTPPHFLDAGVRFTAIVPRHALLDPDDLQWLAALPGTSGASDAQRHALVDMRHGVQFTNLTYRERFPMDSTQARAQLSDLVERGVAEARGEKRGRTYRLDPQADVALSQRPLSLLELVDDQRVDAGRFADQRGDADPPAPAMSALSVTRHAPVLLAALRAGGATLEEILSATGLSARQVSYGLRKLRDAGWVSESGGQGVRGTRYYASGS